MFHAVTHKQLHVSVADFIYIYTYIFVYIYTHVLPQTHLSKNVGRIFNSVPIVSLLPLSTRTH